MGPFNCACRAKVATAPVERMASVPLGEPSLTMSRGPFDAGYRNAGYLSDEQAPYGASPGFE